MVYYLVKCWTILQMSQDVFDFTATVLENLNNLLIFLVNAQHNMT